MIKIIFTIFLAFFCFCCFSQDEWDKRPVIKTNIFNLLMRGPSIALDIAVGKTVSIMPSAAYGKFNWGNFGGLHKYKSFEAEVRKHEKNTYYGVYIKHTTKTVNSEKAAIVYIPISYDRNFKGNGIAFGASTGIEAPLWKRFNIDFNVQLGYGRFYKMTDKFSYDLPSGKFIDYRMAFWVGFQL